MWTSEKQRTPWPFFVAEGETLGRHLEARLGRLLMALEQGHMLQPATRVAGLLGTGWGEVRAEEGPLWPSDITDDHTPFELSLALGDGAETVRLLSEPQDARQPSLVTSWRVARDIHEELARQWQARPDVFDSVADLFAPEKGARASFSIWHSAIFEANSAPAFKIYLNPNIHGVAHGSEVVEACLSRLGLSESWSSLARKALTRPGDIPLYVSLDLSAAQNARAKVYVAHRDATAREVADVLARVPGFKGELVEHWCSTLLGGEGPYTARPPITCFALRRSDSQLYSGTLHLPIRCYTDDDFSAARQICGLLGYQQRLAYMRALTAFSQRPLEVDKGMQTYVSLRPSPGVQAATVYLAPQVYSRVEMPEAPPRGPFAPRRVRPALQ